MNRNSRRNFLKLSIKYSFILITSLAFFTNNYISKKIRLIKKTVYKKKFSKVWILEINDS